MTDDTPNYYQSPNPDSGEEDRDEESSAMAPESDWGPAKRVVQVNLGILLAYTFLLTVVQVSNGGPYAGMALGIWMMMLVGGQCAINLIAAVAAFLSEKPTWAAAYLLGLCAVGFLGFSACFGVMMLV